MSPRVRVLHVCKGLGLGGTEKVMAALAAGLDRSRFEPAVFAFADGERGPGLRRAGVATFVGPDLLGALTRFRPHLVHLHRAGWPEPELLRPLKLAGVRAVVETNVFGRHDPSPSGRIIDLTLFVSRFCATRFRQETGIPAEPPRYDVLYNPVDTDFFARACPERDLSAPVAGRISRADPGKWSALALDILPDLVREVPGFRYRVVGAIPEARSFVAGRGLDRAVDFLPPLVTDQDLAGFLNSVSLLAHANDTGESFGLVIAEAMAAGLPVVTHPCPGLKDNAQLELVDHGVTGLVAADAAAYVQAVKRLLSRPDEALAMGRAGRAKAARLYRSQDVVSRLEGLYLDLLARKGVGAD